MSSTWQTWKPHSRGLGLGNALGMRKTILFPFPPDLVLALTAAGTGFSHAPEMCQSVLVLRFAASAPLGPTSSSSPLQPSIHRECKCSMNCDCLGISSLSHDKQVEDRDLDLRS